MADVTVILNFDDWQKARDRGITVDELGRERLEEAGADVSRGEVLVTHNLVIAGYVFEWTAGA